MFLKVMFYIQVFFIETVKIISLEPIYSTVVGKNTRALLNLQSFVFLKVNSVYYYKNYNVKIYKREIYTCCYFFRKTTVSKLRWT